LLCPGCPMGKGRPCGHLLLPLLLENERLKFSHLVVIFLACMQHGLTFSSSLLFSQNNMRREIQITNILVTQFSTAFCLHLIQHIHILTSKHCFPPAKVKVEVILVQKILATVFKIIKPQRMCVYLCVCVCVCVCARARVCVQVMQCYRLSSDTKHSSLHRID
jgi:hypothetical protein